MIEVRGQRVRLRPLRPDELGAALEARRGFADLAHPIRVDADEDRLRARVGHSGELFMGELLLAVEENGRLVGEIQGRQPEHAIPPGVFELGVELYDEADRGRGLGSEAIALLTAHLFERWGAHRVQASTDVENRPMRRTLERLGFAEEGILRDFMPSDDGPRDYAMYALTKPDWEKTRKTWTFPS